MLKRFITGSTLSLIVLFSLTQILHAAEGSVALGRYHTMLSLGAGTNSTGAFLKTNLLYNTDKGNTFDTGFGYNIDTNSLRIYPSVKVILTRYEERLDGTSISLGFGGGALYHLDRYWSLYGKYHYGIECFSPKRANSYHDINGGIRFTPISMLSLELGYRCTMLHNKTPSNTYIPVEYIAKSPYLGVSVLF
ncbi:YfaZ family outer membrane protein [Candidatus Pantoea edessiphila]|nr:YfaZ family outer membrane protein [Candidatus Pantoea edessiphila]